MRSLRSLTRDMWQSEVWSSYTALRLTVSPQEDIQVLSLLSVCVSGHVCMPVPERLAVGQCGHLFHPLLP